MQARARFLTEDAAVAVLSGGDAEPVVAAPVLFSAVNDEKRRKERDARERRHSAQYGGSSYVYVSRVKVLKTMNCALNMTIFALKMMDFAFKTEKPCIKRPKRSPSLASVGRPHSLARSRPSRSVHVSMHIDQAPRTASRCYTRDNIGTWPICIDMY